MAGGVMDEAKIAELEERIAALEARINKWALNGLSIADARNIFGGIGGLYGTDTTVARTDHTH